MAMEKRVEHISVGRKDIDVHRLGDPSAPAIVYRHGIPSSGEEASLVLAGAAEQGLQVVAPTRPGYGHSTPDVRRNLQKITEDVLRIVDALGIREFYAVGTSGGAKDACALAHREPQRVSGVSLLAGLPPFENPQSRQYLPPLFRAGFTLAKSVPEYATSFFVWLAGFRAGAAHRSPEGEVLQYIKTLPPLDQQFLRQPAVFQSFVSITQDWARSGTGHGLFGDIVRAAQPWGFDPAELKVDVHRIHGEKDPIVPFKAADHSFRTIPGNASTVIPNAGHAIYAFPEVSQEVLAKVKKTMEK